MKVWENGFVGEWIIRGFSDVLGVGRDEMMGLDFGLIWFIMYRFSYRFVYMSYVCNCYM